MDPKEPTFNYIIAYELAWQYGIRTSFTKSWDRGKALQRILKYHDGDVEKSIRGVGSLVAKYRRSAAFRKSMGKTSLYDMEQGRALSLMAALKTLNVAGKCFVKHPGSTCLEVVGSIPTPAAI